VNVVYDLLGFQSRDHGERGIARYVLQLGLALERRRPGLITQYLMHPDLPFPAGAEPLLATGRVVRTDEGLSDRRPTAGGIFIACSPFECFNQPSELVLPAFARTPEWRSIAVIHDLIPAIFPELYLTNTPDRNYYGARLIGLSGFDRYLTNSQATTDDAVDMLGLDPAHITMVGAGADSQFRPPPAGAEQAAAELVADGLIDGLGPGFILFPTGIDPRKNIERTIQAYGRLSPALRRQHQLVLACRLSDPDRAAVNEIAADAGIGDELLVTGYVSDATLCRLYQAAHLVVFPSYYEGFGLPALEAMACGAPVICADATSLIEVQPIAEARFDPMSAPAIADAMERALADHELRRRLRSQELPPFTWDLSAERTSVVIDELIDRLENRRLEVTAPRPRLAVISPLPPQQSGVATYAHRLLAELRRHCDITVFVDTNPAYVWAPEGVTVETTRQFRSTAAGGGAFDRILYFMGNSQYHLEAMRLLEAHPGVVLFHDVRMTELYREMHRLEPDRLVDRSVGATVAALYPGRYRAEVEAMDSIEQDVANRFGLLMARDAARLAERVLVHSNYAATLLHLDTGVEATALFPLPCPRVSGQRPSFDGPPVIASFGVVAPSKQPEKLIAAMPTVRRTCPEARLRFVGPIEAHYRRTLEELAETTGVADGVEFAGTLSDSDFARAQDEATVAVQLRAFSNGESSAAVTELLARGVPTVVSNLGSMAELPDGVVAKLDVSAEPDDLGDLIADLLTDTDRRNEHASAAVAYAETVSFAMAAERLAEALFTEDVPASEATMDELPATLKQTQDQTLFYLDVLKNGQATYLGDYQVLTRLFTGQKIFVDSRDVSVSPALIMDGRWEPETTAALMNLLQPSDCMIDIGANFGYFGLIAGTIIDRSAGGSIHLIEANPHLVPLLFKSLNVTGLVGLGTASNYAISDAEGELDLHIPEGLWGSSFLDSLDDVFRTELETALDQPVVIDEVVTVPSITLDEFCADRHIDRVDVIKIDVEGHEERAYRGMSQVIDQNRDQLRMLIEFSAGQYEDPVGFYEQIRSDFKFVYGLELGSGTLIDIASYADVTAMSGPGFTMLLTTNHEIAPEA